MATISKHSRGKDYVFVSDVDGWVHKDRVIKFRGTSPKFIHHGRGKIGFCVLNDYGFTIVKTVVIKSKDVCSTYYFNGKPDIAEIRQRLFENARHVNTVRKSHLKPFGVIYRYGILPADRWDELYEPNTIFTKYKATDKAFKSLGKCISSTDGDEIRGDTAHHVFFQASRRIARMRNRFIVSSSDNDLPVVEVYAIWSNYDPETSYVIKEDYDAFEPLHYTFNRFSSIQEMKQFPL